jgi:hypothetical protein
MIASVHERKEPRLGGAFFFALVASLFLLLGAARPSPDSERIRRLLPGLWQADQVQDALTIHSTSDYRRDGVVIYTGRITGPGVDLSWRVRSRWRVEGDAVATEILESDQPQMLPVGSRKRDVVLVLDSKVFRYRDADGGEHEERRVAAK